MLRMHLAVPLAALMAGSAWAQTSPAPAPTQGSTASAGSGQVLTEMQPNLMRGSRLMGVDVYGSDNQKIGDIDEVLLDRDGRIHAVVVGIGGFLGIGQKDVALPFGQLRWMSDEEVRAATNAAGAGTNTAGGVTTPAGPIPGTAGPAAGTAGTANQPATTGSTGAPGTGMGGTIATPARVDDGTPARAMVSMSKADLQNAPEFRYSTEASRNAGPVGNTNPPPASANRPGNAPQQ
jgi:sporulation protein YlmC with PRC-barrel domain